LAAHVPAPQLDPPPGAGFFATGFGGFTAGLSLADVAGVAGAGVVATGVDGVGSLAAAVVAGFAGGSSFDVAPHPAAEHEACPLAAGALCTGTSVALTSGFDAPQATRTAPAASAAARDERERSMRAVPGFITHVPF
jgi:hypothetical protein